MVQIEITKQPLYGSVYWNGYDFIYTPKTGFTGNDVYYYNKIENGIISSHRNYVNPSNVAPIVTNVSLSADAYNKTILHTHTHGASHSAAPTPVREQAGQPMRHEDVAGAAAPSS